MRSAVTDQLGLDARMRPHLPGPADRRVLLIEAKISGENLHGVEICFRIGAPLKRGALGTAGDEGIALASGQCAMHIMATPPAEITGLLLAWSGGDEAALEQLMPLVHRELHQIARRCMANERAGHSLQATALVNEAFLRLINVRRVNWQNRAHFSGGVGPPDAPDSGRVRSSARVSETRRARPESDAGRRAHGQLGAGARTGRAR